MESKTGPNATSAPSALLKIGLRHPDGGVVGHVVAGGEELHLRLARVDHVDNIVNGDAGFSDIRRKDNLQRKNEMRIKLLCGVQHYIPGIQYCCVLRTAKF